MKILVIEDDKGTAEVIKTFLSENGHNIQMVFTGNDAVKKLKEESFELLILDYRLPDMTGEIFIEVIKNEGISLVPFIVTTGSGDERIAVKMMKLGAKDYIIKDIHFFEMLPHIIERTGNEIFKENKLKESEEKYQSFIKQSTEGIYRIELKNPIDINTPIDRQLDLIYDNAYIAECNEAFAKMYDSESKEFFINKKVIDLHGEKNHPTNREDLTKFIKNNYVVENELTEKQSLRGRLFWLSNNSIGIVENSKLYRIWGTQRDITEQIEANRVIEESKEKYKTLYDNAPLCFQSLNAEGCFVDINPAWSNTLGYKKEEVIGKYYADFLHPDFITKFENNFPILLEHGCVKDVHFKLRHKDGYYIDISLEGSSGINKKGNKQTYCVFKDITEQLRYETELKISKARNEAMLSNISDVVGIIDKNEVVLFKSSNITSIFGWEPNELEGRSVWDTVHPDHIENAKNYFNYLLLNKEKQLTFELSYKKKDGTFVPIQLTASNMLDNKYINGILINYHDISESKLAEQKLKESEEKFRSIFEAHSAVETLIDFDTGNIVDANIAASEFYGWKIEELKSMHISEINTLSFDKIKKEIEKVRKGEKTFFNFQHRLADKSVRDVEVYSSRINISNKDYLHSIIHDVTHKKKIEKELQKLSQAVIQSPISIVITNYEGEIEFINPAFKEITGYSFNEVIGKNPNILNSGKQDKSFYSEMWESIKSGKTWQGRFHNKKKNGELFWESSIISPLKNQEGEITNFIAVKEDITKEVELENELEKHQKELERLIQERTSELQIANENLNKEIAKSKFAEKEVLKAYEKEKELNEIKTRLISTVSHEFRTPLTGIKGSAEILEMFNEKMSKEDLLNHLKKIVDSSDYLTELIENVLNMNKTESNRVKFNPQKTNLKNLIFELINDHKQNNSDTIISLEYRTNRLEYLIDINIIKIIVNNLISNAIKYSPKESTIKIKVEENESLIIKVIDEGFGISKEDQKHIFEPFFRVEEHSEIKGTGMGLSIVREYVKLHKGSISLNSKLNNGTTVAVRLPILRD